MAKKSILSIPAVAGTFCLLLVLAFHSPRWWIIAEPARGTFEWDRALTYLAQCEDPFREDVEPATRWRFVPQIFVYAFGGNEFVAIAIPWVGALLLAWYMNSLLQRRGLDPVTAFWLSIVLLSSAPVFVSTGWLGFNDAWVALGLLVVAFGRTRVGLVLACLLCACIDERFAFGLPGAVLVRNYPFRERRWWTIAAHLAAALSPFIALRVLGLALGRSGNAQFLISSLQASTTYLWFAPLALWMAWRFAYVPTAERLLRERVEYPFACVILLMGNLLPVLVGFAFAADTLRTALILMPLCAWGVLQPGRIGRRQSFLLAAANLLVPAAHVTHTKVAPINSIFIELWRVLR